VSLWIEIAYQSLARAGEDVCSDVVRTSQNEERFFAILACGPQGGAEGKAKATLIADKAASMLAQRTSLDLDKVVENLLAVLPQGEYVPFSILQVLGGCRAYVVECDTPPLFLTRGGQLVLLPVLEEISHGHLIRECRFLLRDGDHLAMVSEGYLRPRGWGWSWADVAVAVRRWTDTRCDADELSGALVRTYRRLNPEAPRQDVTIVAMHIRPERRATVWTGPPADPAQDEVTLDKLMAEQGARIICGDTTAQIAARLLGAKLELEPRPEDGTDKRHSWAEVPPVANLEGVSLVTEGLVTLGKARERMDGAQRLRDLPRGEDGATRLARALLIADKIHFIVGLAVNPQQADESGTVPLRRLVVEELIRALKAEGKLVSVEYL